MNFLEVRAVLPNVFSDQNERAHPEVVKYHRAPALKQLRRKVKVHERTAELVVAVDEYEVVAVAGVCERGQGEIGTFVEVGVPRCGAAVEDAAESFVVIIDLLKRVNTRERWGGGGR